MENVMLRLKGGLSKTWQNYFEVINNSNRVYRFVEFLRFEAPKNENDHIKFNELLNYLGQTVSIVHFQTISCLKSSVFEQIIEHFPNLKSLMIQNVDLISDKTNLGRNIIPNNQQAIHHLKDVSVFNANGKIYNSLVNIRVQSEEIAIRVSYGNNNNINCISDFLATQQTLKSLRVYKVERSFSDSFFKIFRNLCNAATISLHTLKLVWDGGYLSERHITYLNDFLTLQSQTLVEFELELRHIPESLMQCINMLKLQTLKVTCTKLSDVKEEFVPNFKLKRLSLILRDFPIECSLLEKMLTAFPAIENFDFLITMAHPSPYLLKQVSISEKELKIVAERLKFLKTLCLKNITVPKSDIFFPSLKKLFLRCDYDDNELSISRLLNCNPTIDNLQIEFIKRIETDLSINRYKSNDCRNNSKQLCLSDMFPAFKHLINLTEISILFWYSNYELSMQIDDKTLELFQDNFKNLDLITIIYKGKYFEENFENSVWRNITGKYRFRIIEFNDKFLSDGFPVDEEYYLQKEWETCEL